MRESVRLSKNAFAANLKLSVESTCQRVFYETKFKLRLTIWNTLVEALKMVLTLVLVTTHNFCTSGKRVRRNAWLT